MLLTRLDREQCVPSSIPITGIQFNNYNLEVFNLIYVLDPTIEDFMCEFYTNNLYVPVSL